MLVEDCVDIVVENNKVEKVTNDVTQDVGKNAMLKVGENYTSDTGKVLSLNAGKSIEIKVGGASIQMSSSGEINIKATDFYQWLCNRIESRTNLFELRGN